MRRIECVYFVREGDRVRIGTTSNLATRYRNLKSRCKRKPFYLVGYVETAGARDPKELAAHYESELEIYREGEHLYGVRDDMVENTVDKMKKRF